MHAPKLKEMLGAFERYNRGFGQIVLQTNYDDDLQGVSDYAILECGAKAIEFKFGQSAKGTQPANRIGTLEEGPSGKRSTVSSCCPTPRIPPCRRPGKREPVPPSTPLGGCPCGVRTAC